MRKVVCVCRLPCSLRRCVTLWQSRHSRGNSFLGETWSSPPFCWRGIQLDDGFPARSTRCSRDGVLWRVLKRCCEIVFDLRLVRLMTTSLRNFTSDNVEVSLDRITSVRFGDYMNSIPLPGGALGVQGEEVGEFSGLADRRSRA